MFSKLSKVAAIVTATAVIAGATIKVLSYEFVKTDQLKPLFSADSSLNVRCNNVEKDQVRVMQKLDDMSSDVKDIKKYVMRAH